MAMIPLISNFEADFVLQVLPVDSENTMDEVAAAAAYHSVGRRVAARPGHVMRVREQGAKEPFPRNAKVSELMLKPMQCVEVVWESPN